MTTNTMPELEDGAIQLADLAFIETAGSDGARVRAAIRAYMWALENISEIVPGLEVYPSSDELREAMTK